MVGIATHRGAQHAAIGADGEHGLHHIGVARQPVRDLGQLALADQGSEGGRLLILDGDGGASDECREQRGDEASVQHVSSMAAHYGGPLR